jgi:hypothetical protein
MRRSRVFCALLIISAICAATVRANWMTFAGGPVVAVGTWPAGNVLSGAAVVTASNFVNGNLSTPFIGLTPIAVSNLSPDYFATGLIPNAGPVVTSIGTPYNDAGDTYHVVVDFTATTGGTTPGTLPANSIFAILDLDITENYRNITATNAANAQIVTPWINGPNGYFDMTNPMIPQGSLIPNPTIAGPVAGVYQMFGVSYNFDVGMWLFQTTQDVKTIAFDMEKGAGGTTIGGGGATWAFYTSPIPEPTSVALVWGALIIGGCLFRRELRCQ